MGLGKRRAAYILAGALAACSSILSPEDLGSGGAIARRGVQAAESDGGTRLLLPSCGVQYALSATKVSMRDVEEDLYDRGVIREKKTVSTVSTVSTVNTVSTASTADSGDTVSAADSADTAATAEVTETAEAAPAPVAYGAAILWSGQTPAQGDSAADKTESTETSALLETELTPVQQTEQQLVRADAQSLGSLDEARAVEMAAGAAEAVQASTDASNASPEGDVVLLAAGGAEAPAADAAQTETAADVTTEETAAAAQTSDAAADPAAASEDTAGTAESEASADASSESPAENAAAEDTGTDPELAVSTASSYVNIRKEPSESAEIVGKLYANSVGTVVEDADENGWVKITSGSVSGYVKSDYVATGDSAKDLADAVGKQKAVVTTQTLRVRAAASTESDVISLIGQGQTLDILAEEDGWYKVDTEDGEGYISADFTDVEVEYPEAVSIEEEQAALEAAQAEEEAKEAAAAQESQKQQAAQAQAAASQGQAVVNYAMQFLGNPYVWGGSSLTNGTDCSGFTMSVYAHFGVSLPHYDAAQRSCGTAVSGLSAARPGDIVCYYGHVGIYIGNGQIINASNPRNGICITNASYRQIVAIRRIFT